MAIQRGRRLPFVILPWAVLEGPLSATDVLVYCTIARFADNETGQAYPSRSTIAIYARCSESTVDRSVKALIDAGFLTKQARRTKAGDPDSNLYVIHEIAEQGVASPVKGGGVTGDDWGGVMGDDLTRPNQLEGRTTSEWTEPPADVREKMAALGIGGTE